MKAYRWLWTCHLETRLWADSAQSCNELLSLHGPNSNMGPLVSQGTGKAVHFTGRAQKLEEAADLAGVHI